MATRPTGPASPTAGPHPNPGRVADGKRLHRLEPEPVKAPVVRRISAELVRDEGLRSIADMITADGLLSPSANVPARNPHRRGSSVALRHKAVRVILGSER